MESLHINIYPDLVYYPTVDFNYETGICEIAGESYMEESFKFFEPVILWLREYISMKKPISFNIKLTYFNTSTSRFILEILDMLKNYQDEGNDVQVNWFYKKEDPDMLNEINDFAGETGVIINISAI
jgi:hypothetical protein